MYDELIHNNIILGLLSAFCCITMSLWGMHKYYEQRWRDEFHAFFWAVQVSICIGLIHLWQYLETNSDVTNLELQLWKNSGFIMGVLIIRQLLYRFVHSIFFTTEEIALWRSKYIHVFGIESSAILLLSFIVLFQPITIKIATYLLFIVLVIVKIIIFKADIKTIFQNPRAFLHFFVYFCTLEIAPLIFCWAFLGKFYD